MNHNTSPCRTAQRGFSLIEAALALMILGLGTITLWKALGATHDQRKETDSAQLLQRADHALMTFAALNGRLPCPSANEIGEESQPCDKKAEDAPKSTAIGRLPFRTLGVIHPSAGRINYEVMPALTQQPRTQTVLANRGPLNRDQEPTFAKVPFHEVSSDTYDGILDLCHSLSSLEHKSSDKSTALLTYEATDSLSFLALTQRSVERKLNTAALMRNLNCRALTSLSARAHFNTHLAWAVLVRTMQDVFYTNWMDWFIALSEVNESMATLLSTYFNQLKTWVDEPQKTASMIANIWKNPAKFAQHAKDLAKSIMTQAGAAASLAQELSNFYRYRDIVHDQGRRLRYMEGLIGRSIEGYKLSTANAVILTSSAFMLNEQTRIPTAGPLPDLASASANGDYALWRDYALEQMKKLGRPDFLEQVFEDAGPGSLDDEQQPKIDDAQPKR